MSFFDDDIKRSVWDGKIPVMFSMSGNDVTHHTMPAPYMMMVPRNSYFPLVTGAVRDYFSHSTLIMSDNELWLEYKGIPIKWHLPIGVLFDVLVGSESGTQIWNLTVHFQSFPEKILLRCPNEESVETYYKNVLKEANYIKQGDINKLNNLNINQSNELWDGLRQHIFPFFHVDDYDKFWSINKLFYNVNVGGSSTGIGYKHIPVRLIQNNRPYVQNLIAPYNESGAELTLSDYFSKIPFYSIFIGGATEPSSSSPTTTNTGELSTSSSSTSMAYTNLLQYIKAGAGKYLIQGVEPPLESSFLWLGEYFSHPDNFLYITLIDSTNQLSLSSSSIPTSPKQQQTI
ncbi:autophagy protein 5 [Cavenderia fasciculata]|uniref:Autophagy protein 5 n=1 Tax=Cavenderia fasciculata TaxID=261658 RepID=F4PVW9_CACFS|nr:autophagy protein 5 [Cavenderia fasciculata]EGG20133.1 autophagy protein 5 [Cavenderia fasciculata]|eukprot:XP_004367116.1 autophagy protein 5 [Cavenderia fasciculata]